MQKTGLVLIAALVTGGTVLHVAVHAQGKTAAAGIYTAAQAAAGATAYEAKCAACHGNKLEGMGPMPPLSGADFVATWSGQSVGELLDKIAKTMPATDPGSMSPEESASIVAHILSINKFPAGTTALPTDAEALLPVKVGAPK